MFTIIHRLQITILKPNQREIKTDRQTVFLKHPVCHWGLGRDAATGKHLGLGIQVQDAGLPSALVASEPL